MKILEFNPSVLWTELIAETSTGLIIDFYARSLYRCIAPGELQFYVKFRIEIRHPDSLIDSDFAFSSWEGLDLPKSEEECYQLIQSAKYEWHGHCYHRQHRPLAEIMNQINRLNTLGNN